MLIRIATRNSPLAINQAWLVAKELQFHHRDIKFELLKLQTQGDTIQSQAARRPAALPPRSARQPLAQQSRPALPASTPGCP